MDKLFIFAGPCSVDENNASEIVEISKLGITGTRVVGLKSRTCIEASCDAMGIDYESYIKNLNFNINGITTETYVEPPSVRLMKEIHDQTGLVMATEIMNPLVQIPPIQKHSDLNMLLWNPSVNQLGWQVYETAHLASKNNWHVGIKNGKWLGTNVEDLENPHTEASIEKTWKGLVSYAKVHTEKVISIHRGFDVPNKNQHRNLPLHSIAHNVKKHSNTRLFFDPSHAYGPKLRDEIIEETIMAMQLKIEGNEFLYDGILIEVGTSKTDTDQHLTIEEFKDLVFELSKFRNLQSPKDF
jgi:3-deoxy-D-arabino-heptulosonate 7-phosphate (DAHP) synthase